MEHAFHPPMREPVTAPTYTPDPVDDFSRAPIMRNDQRVLRAELAHVYPDRSLRFWCEGMELCGSVTLGETFAKRRARSPRQLATYLNELAIELSLKEAA